MEVYRRAQYGFFHGDGRHFWWRPGAGLRGYLRYEIGSWLVGTFLLLTAGAVGLVRWVRRRSPAGLETGDLVLACCAALHTGFVTLFFASRWSWGYYYDILVMGLAALAARGRKTTPLIWGLALLVLIRDRAAFQEAYGHWTTESTSADTAGLWATSQQRAEWVKVLELTRGEHPVLLAHVQGAALLFPRFAPPAGAYFVPGHPVPSEVRRLAAQVASASIIVRAEFDFLSLRPFATWSEVVSALDGCEVLWEGEVFHVYRRVRPPRTS
jgi:hypothetical protein